MQSGPPRKEVPKGKVFICSVTICHLTPVSVVAWLWEACDEVFQSDLFPLCPPSVLDSIGCLLFGPIEQRWHLQRLFWTQPGSLPICCTWETSLEEGKRMANLWLHLVSQILHRAAFNLSFCSELSAVLVVTTFARSFRGVCNRNVVWIFCDCNSGNL